MYGYMDSNRKCYSNCGLVRK